MKYLLATILCLLAIAPAAAQDAVDLRPKFAEGQTRLYEEWTRYTTNTHVRFPNGRESKQSETAELNAEIAWTVDKVKPSGEATCEIAVKWLEVSLTNSANGQSQTLKVDTRKGPGEHAEFHKLLKEVVDNPLVYTIKPDGTIAKVAGTDKLKLRVDMVGAERAEKEALYNIAGMTQPGELPESLKINSTWKQDLLGYAFEDNQIEIPVTYTLSDVTTIEDVPVAVISAEASPVLLPPDYGNIPPNAPKPTFKPGKTSYNSEIFIDLDRNEVTARHTAQQQAYSLSIKAPNGAVLNVDRDETVEAQTLRVMTAD
ncbi:hypothetical protein [Mucisphaera calidilacus]|uniref:Uncharacterized protein n=1 Tax=Mucisphaera calidilacus TaxID=2527982 RepID=A0A518C111_9BACT|nr:hypothetical protein [Mucisphaera calidilacus]QDU72909.1 hypothetical protein Pan265_27850 [Mucisphaera calidilacus]